MADNAKILEDLKTAIETWNVQLAVDSTNAAIEAGIEPKVIVNDGLGMGMADVGRRFDAAEIFLPQVVAASKTMEAALKILEPLMSGGASAMKGTVVMGTVEGDIHEIGKNVCCAMLRGAGYNVIDLGPDGGDRGGTIVAQGTPEEVCKVSSSYTGQFLKNVLFSE